MVRVACVEARDVGLGLRGMVDGEGHLVRGRVRGRGRGSGRGRGRGRVRVG